MKRVLFNLAAGASLALATLLAFGYVAVFGQWCTYFPTTGANGSALTLAVEAGRASAVLQALPPQKGSAGTGLNFRWFGHLWTWPEPSLTRALWEFKARPLVAGSGGPGFVIAFPIWCAQLASLILPALRLRKFRRRRREPAGFPVQTASPPA